MKTEKEILDEIEKIEAELQNFINEIDEDNISDDENTQIEFYELVIKKLRWILE